MSWRLLTAIGGLCIGAVLFVSSSAALLDHPQPMLLLQAAGGWMLLSYAWHEVRERAER